jgi:hypothetical protein
MDAQREDGRGPRRPALRIRLVRHSAVAQALDNSPAQPLPIRRVAGQRASERLDARAVAQARATRSVARQREAVARQREAVARQRAAAARERAISVSAHERTFEAVSADRVRGPGLLRRLHPSGESTRPYLRPRRVLVAACAVGLLAVGGVAYVLVERSGRHSAAQPASTSTSTPTPTPTSTPIPTAASAPASAAVNLRLAEAWIRGNVPRVAALRADSVVAAQLISAGYRSAGPSVSIDTAGAFLVTTPKDRDHARRDLARAADRVSSLPVAAFGAGAQRVEVSLLVDGSASSLRTRLVQQTAERLAADRALLANPRLTVADAALPSLTDGRLDLRAATVLALLAARTDVHIVRISLHPAEATAERPARTFAVSLSNPAVLSNVLRELPSPYAPAQVSAARGVWQLTWPVGLAPEGL